MKIGNREFDFDNHTYVMGILNITPDSFSDGGKYTTMDAALIQVERMLSEGMDILDIGGMSTRPGHEFISEDEEIRRVIPVLSEVKKRYDVPISVDTYRSKVARASICMGADLINDIWGLKNDSAMAQVVADSGVCYCLMHNNEHIITENVVENVIADLEESLQIADAAGIDRGKILLDPGIGFAKNTEGNLILLNHLADLHRFGLPLLLGCSRKSVIGNTLNLPADDRLEGTLVTTTLAVLARYGVVRVHDVKENLRTIAMTEAIRNS